MRQRTRVIAAAAVTAAVAAGSTAGRVLSRSQIFESVWGYDFGPESNGLWVYISYLRRKMGEPRLIQTVRGLGYVLREEE